MDLPEDLVSDILSRLSLKSLLRFRCVHKSWNSLLKSSYFTSNHLKNPNNKDRFILVKYHHQDLDSQNLRFRLLNSGTFDICLDLETPFESDPWCFNVIGSCNGLVCLHDVGLLHGRPRIIICNPFLKQYKIIPQPTFLESLDLFITASGFCYDSINNDYKVVRVGDNEKGKGYSSRAEVYTLGMNYWRKVVELLDFRFHDWENQAFLNGAIHWSGLQNKKRSLISFDASSEVFQLFPSPGCFAVGKCLNVRIDVLRDSLCVVHSLDWNYEIWVMKEYGVEGSWTRLHAITLSSPIYEPELRFLGFGVNGELFLNDTTGLATYYPDNQEFKKVVDYGQRVPFYAALTYIETLVSLEKFNLNDLLQGDDNNYKI